MHSKETFQFNIYLYKVWSLHIFCLCIWAPTVSRSFFVVLSSGVLPHRPATPAPAPPPTLGSFRCCCAHLSAAVPLVKYIFFFGICYIPSLVHSMGLMYGILWCWWQWTPGWLDVLAVQLVLSVGSCPVPATGSKSPTTSPPPHIFRLLSIFVCLYLCLLHFLFASRLFSVCLLFRLKIAFFFKYT